MKKYKIAVIPGDGIGPEVIGEAIKVLDRCGEKFSFSFEWEKFPYGAGHYLATGLFRHHFAGGTTLPPAK